MKTKKKKPELLTYLQSHNYDTAIDKGLIKTRISITPKFAGSTNIVDYSGWSMTFPDSLLPFGATEYTIKNNIYSTFKK